MTVHSSSLKPGRWKLKNRGREALHHAGGQFRNGKNHPDAIWRLPLRADICTIKRPGHNNIAMFNIMHDMNPKSKLLNVAFAVSAAFVFGDHLGFAAGNNPDMIFPVVVGKLTAGITALILANLLLPKLLSKIETTGGKDEEPDKIEAKGDDEDGRVASASVE